MLKKFIGIDFGTQGVRVGLVSTDGTILDSKEVKYPIHHEQPGYATQDSEDWLTGLNEAMHSVLDPLSEEDKKSIVSITVDATSSTTIGVSKQGKAVTEALMWMDIRSKDQATRINETNSEVLKYCGDAVSPEWFIPKVLWFKEERHKDYKKSEIFVEQLDFINHLLTGKWVASKLNAVCKWNYIDGVGFDEDYMKLIGLEDYKEKIITNVVKMGDVIGTLTVDFADRYGLSQDVKVVQGGIDAHIGMIGMGVVKPGKLATSLGTSFVQLIFTDNKDSGVTGIWGPYNGAMIDGLTLLEAGQISAGSIIKWYQNIFDLNSSTAHEIMNEEVKDIPVGANGLIALDFFQGNRTPYKDSYSTGAFHGLTLNHDRAHIHKAIMESVGFGFKNIVDNFEKFDVKIDEVICTGGVTFDKIWMQILSDITGKEFIINTNTNYGTLLGDAILGSVGAGVYQSLEEAVEHMVHVKEKVVPNLQNTEKYQPLFEKYIRLYEGLKTVDGGEK